jgi:outer membrane protein, adhesin transport system
MQFLKWLGLHLKVLRLCVCLCAMPVLGAAAQTPSEWQSGLPAALAATLSNHPLLRSKQFEVQAKQALGDSARAQRLPTMSGSASSADNNGTSAALRARQPLWAFGRIDSAIAYADTDVLAEQADRLRVQRQLLDQTAVAYARVLGVRQKMQVAADNVAGLRALQQQIMRRAKGQAAPEVDVRLANARLAQAQTQYQQMQGDLQVVLQELAALTQVPVDSEQAVPSGWLQLPPLEALEARMLEQNADLAHKKRLIELAQADIEQAKRAAMPTVYLQAESFLNQPAVAEQTRWGVQLEGNLEGLGWVAKGRTAAAQARWAAAQAGYDTTRSDLFRTMRSWWAQREQQQRLLDNVGEAITELDATLASYRRQYDAGYKAWLDVLNFQREVHEQRMAWAQAQTDWTIYSLKLAALMGALDDFGGMPVQQQP